MSGLPQRETAKARQAFENYWALGPDRSLAKLAEKYGKSRSYVVQLGRWSVSWYWQQRVLDREIQLGQEALEAEGKARAEMRERQINVGRVMQTLAQRGLRILAEKGDDVKFTVNEISQLAKIGTEIERLARGETTENVGLTVSQEDEFAKAVLANPDMAELAGQLLAELTSLSQGYAGGIRLLRQPETLEDGSPPGVIEP